MQNIIRKRTVNPNYLIPKQHALAGYGNKFERSAMLVFEAKIYTLQIDRISFMDQHHWDTFNADIQMMEYIMSYHKKFGFFPN